MEGHLCVESQVRFRQFTAFETGVCWTAQEITVFHKDGKGYVCHSQVLKS
jgi:hypothetical protein